MTNYFTGSDLTCLFASTSIEACLSNYTNLHDASISYPLNPFLRIIVQLSHIYASSSPSHMALF